MGIASDEQGDHQPARRTGGSRRAGWSREKRRAEKMARFAKAAEIMRKLIELLAPNGQCQKCGKKPRTHSLQIHHLDGRDWEPREHSLDIRARRYQREVHEGKRLAAWCIQCNSGVHPDADAETAKRRLNGERRARSKS